LGRRDLAPEQILRIEGADVALLDQRRLPEEDVELVRGDLPRWRIWRRGRGRGRARRISTPVKPAELITAIITQRGQHRVYSSSLVQAAFA
jgi:methylthioribose-1-phosphate isomerase